MTRPVAMNVVPSSSAASRRGPPGPRRKQEASDVLSQLLQQTKSEAPAIQSNDAPPTLIVVPTRKMMSSPSERRNQSGPYSGSIGALQPIVQGPPPKEDEAVSPRMTRSRDAETEGQKDARTNKDRHSDEESSEKNETEIESHTAEQNSSSSAALSTLSLSSSPPQSQLPLASSPSRSTVSDPLTKGSDASGTETIMDEMEKTNESKANTSQKTPIALTRFQRGPNVPSSPQTPMSFLPPPTSPSQPPAPPSRRSPSPSHRPPAVSSSSSSPTFSVPPSTASSPSSGPHSSSPPSASSSVPSVFVSAMVSQMSKSGDPIIRPAESAPSSANHAFQPAHMPSTAESQASSSTKPSMGTLRSVPVLPTLGPRRTPNAKSSETNSASSLTSSSSSSSLDPPSESEADVSGSQTTAFQAASPSMTGSGNHRTTRSRSNLNRGALSCSSALRSRTTKLSDSDLKQMILSQDLESITAPIVEEKMEKLVKWLAKKRAPEFVENLARVLCKFAFPEETIPGLRNKLLQSGSYSTILRLCRAGCISVHRIIAPEELVFGEIIAKGAGGRIHTGFWGPEKMKVAIKVVSQDGCFFSNEEEVRFELSLMSILNNKNIASCVGGNLSLAASYIVSPLFERGCLSKVLHCDEAVRTRSDLSMRSKLVIAMNIAKGMEYLHAIGILHRDLKPSNILVGADDEVAVTDFGISRMRDRGRMTLNVGTIQWIAPEILEGNGKYTETADVYSFSILFWEMITECRPFENVSLHQLPMSVVGGTRPAIPSDVKPEIATLMEQCWDDNPKKRPRFTDVVRALENILAHEGK